VYQPKLPDDTVNLSPSSPLVTVVKLALALALVASIAYFSLGYLIDITVSSITPEQEAKLEKLFVTEDNLTDTKSSYLKRVTRKMTRCAALPYPIHIRIMEESEPNAFAVPGGVIYLTRGILKKMKSENELAFIIGHELGHFKHKDHLRGMGYKLIVGMLGLLLGSDYGAATQMTLGIGSARHSQSAELEADAFALEMMQCAYGSVSGATTLFEKMDTGHEWRYFMATHPGFKTRIEKIKEEILQKHFSEKGTKIPLGSI